MERNDGDTQRRAWSDLKLLIQYAWVVDPATGLNTMANLLLEDGKIAKVGGGPMQADQVIDAAGLVAAPGLVDMHVHLREPGFEYKETVATGCAAAAHGGVTTLVAMANTKPVTDSPEQVRAVMEKAAATGVTVLPVGAVTKGLGGVELTDFAALKEAGAPALSDDGVPIQDEELLRRAMEEAKAVGLPILDHCEDKELVQNYAVNAGPVADALGLPGRPAVAEEMQVERDVRLAEETGAHVHICHISTAKSVDIVRKAKARGVTVTCETCPQYFTLTEQEVLKQGALARVNPPLRTQADVEGIIQGLVDGTIDAIVTDHAPHSSEEKARPLAEAPSGMVGLESSLALALTALYHTGKLSLPHIVAKMSCAPALILGLKGKGNLAIGSDADLVLFDPDEEWIVDPEEFASKGRNTPFAGWQVKGRVKYTIAGGRVLYQDS